tara:strand:+ start:829 stop:1134 length:306 start_codon:yes stop_codon:yes gene_type:complete
MNSRFSFDNRISQQLNHLLALSALDDNAQVDALWSRLKREVYNEGHANGVSAMVGEGCVLPRSLQHTPLEMTYRKAFLDGYVHRCVLGWDASWFSTSSAVA